MVQMGSGNLFGSSSSNMANFGQFQGFEKSMSMATTNSKNANLSLLSGSTQQGLKEETSTLYNSDSIITQTKQSKAAGAMPMSATALLQKAAQMGSTRSNNNNNNPSIFGNSSCFNVMSSSSSSSPSSNHAITSFNNNLSSAAVSLAMSDGVIGSSIPSTSGTLNQLMIQQASGDQQNNNNNEQIQLKLTRDFLGVSGHHQSMSSSVRQFLPQELAKLAASIGSSSPIMGLQQFTANH